MQSFFSFSLLGCSGNKIPRASADARGIFGTWRFPSPSRVSSPFAFASLRLRRLALRWTSLRKNSYQLFLLAHPSPAPKRALYLTKVRCRAFFHFPCLAVAGTKSLGHQPMPEGFSGLEGSPVQVACRRRSPSQAFGSAVSRFVGLPFVKTVNNFFTRSPVSRTKKSFVFN